MMASEMSISERMEKIQIQNQQILDFVLAKRDKKKKKEVDENEERGNWSGQLDFFLSCLGYAVGLGNLWRFPYLCYQNGGGAFLIPYTVMLVFLGMPIFFMELSLGQFTSRGPFGCWNFAPLFSGIGIAMTIVSAIVAVFYNIIIAWSIYYLFDSFRTELPWAKCDPAWATPQCMDYLPMVTRDYCENHYNHTNHTAGICTNGTSMAIFDEKLAKISGISRKLPSAEYLNRHVLKSEFSTGITDLGSLQSPIVLCYFVAFVFIGLSLSKSIKSSGKVVYFTATFPYLVMLILLIRGVTLDGADLGIAFYTTPDLDRLYDSAVWMKAAEQIFFSLSASYGGLIALSSYNKFHTNTLRDTLAVTIANCLTSVFAGFAIFSYIGNLAYNMGVPVQDVTDDGPTLAFVIYPYAVTQLPGSQFWAILFFFMLLTLGVDSEFVVVETVMTGLADKFPKFRDYKKLSLTACCLILFIVGLPLATSGGVYVLTVLDYYGASWTVLVIALCECIAMAGAYGVWKFASDIEYMIGQHPLGVFLPWKIVKYWWMACWSFFAPILLSFILIYSWVDFKSLSAKGMSTAADVIGWIVTLVVLLPILIRAIYLIWKTPGSLTERLMILTSASEKWGPVIPKYREKWDDHVMERKLSSWRSMIPKMRNLPFMKNRDQLERGETDKGIGNHAFNKDDDVEKKDDVETEKGQI